MNQVKNFLRGALGVLVAVGVVEIALPARAQDPPATGSPTMAEFNKLKDEVREQRQLILQILQNEQSRYDMLLKLIGAQGGAGQAVRPADEQPMPVSGEPATASAGGAARSRQAGEPARQRNAFVEGRVTVTGGAVGDVFVYIDGVKAPLVRGKTIEIKQENKQFVPRLAVVQAGTSIVFPNFDSVYHNVFSTSPRNTFDLGSYRAGDKPRAVTLTSPGVVEIFCNMHQKMSAEVLVVPSPLYTKVKADGTFRLENVPVGARRVVAWGPSAKPMLQKVDVSAAGGQTTFVLEREEGKAHANKLGQAYGSYRE
jgi:plastocyanin